MTTTNEYLTTEEVAERLRISVHYARFLCKTGQLPALRLGKSYRVHPDALDALVKSGAVLKSQRGWTDPT